MTSAGQALAHAPQLRVVLVPHEIDPPHLAALERTFAAYPGVRYSALRAAQGVVPRWRVLLVDAVGVLSALYAHAALAYVGGAFTTGVHNVMEPAAMGVPPIFGPLHHNAPEALHLVAAGAAFAVADAADFRRCLFALLDDPPRARALGARARAYVESQGGAAERACAAIRAALAPPPGAGAGALAAGGKAGRGTP